MSRTYLAQHERESVVTIITIDIIIIIVKIIVIVT